MLRAKAMCALIHLFILVAGIGLLACASSPQPAVESPPQPTQPSAPAPPPSQPSEIAAANPADVQAKINAIYQGTVFVDNSRVPAFFVGDFNGDLYQDLAVVVRPQDGRLNDINHELANWMLGDPLEKVLPEPKVVAKSAPVPKRVRVERGDLLLAIIHGYGAGGWRSQEATQSFLLRHVAGIGMSTQTMQELLAAAKKSTRLPAIRGDVLRETLGGQQGFVYYDGAGYSWCDPKAYKQKAPGQLVH